MNTEQIDALWKTPSNWTAGLFYHCKEDPRLIVYKRQKWQGWTVNFSRPMAIPLTLIIIAAVLAPIKLLSILEIYSKQKFYITVLVEIIALSAFCFWMSNPKRFENKKN